MENNNRLKSVWNDGVRRAKFWLVGAATLISTTSALGQKGYNDKCNGSPAWLSSTIETRGTTNPAATISANNKYYGINQLDKHNVKKLFKFINSNDKYLEIQNKLKFDADGSVNNASWVALAKKHTKVFTEAQEDYICQVYLPECFQRLQKSLISDAKEKQKKPVVISQINPTILSIFSHDYVKAPYSNKPYNALKNIQNVEDINKEEFIKGYLKSGHLQDKAISAFNDETIEWKDAQLLALCKKAQDEAKPHLDTVKATNYDKRDMLANIHKKRIHTTNDKTVVNLIPYEPVAKPTKIENVKVNVSNGFVIRKDGRT